MERRVEVAIVGGDLAGVATAYHLVREGIGTLLVVPPESPLRRNIDILVVHHLDYLLSKIAVRAYKQLRAKNYTEKRGALWLFQDENTLRLYEKLNKRIWGPLGATARLLPLGEIEEIYPQINTKWYIFAAHTKEELVVDIDNLKRELLREARRKGLLAITRKVKEVKTSRGRVESIILEGIGRISIDNLVVTEEAPKNILKKTPIEKLLLETTKTITEVEPYKYTTKPIIIDYNEANFYIWQSRKGEVKILYKTIGETTQPTLKTLTRTSRLLSKILHGGLYLRITKTETNTTLASKTKYPIVGTNNQLPEGVYVNIGYATVGEPIAYYTSKLLAEQITRNKTPREIEQLQPPQTKNG